MFGDGNNIVLPIYNANGEQTGLTLRKPTYSSQVMSLDDKIVGDVYYRDTNLALSMQEYVVYDNVKYNIINPPTIVREGLVKDNSDSKGMTKYSFEFYHPMYMLSNFPFTDIAVSSDELRYKSQDKTFSWVGYIKDFIDKLNKNLQSTQWLVVLSDNVTEDKIKTLSEVLSFDNSTIAEALKTAYETWEVPYVVDNLHEGEYFNDHNIDYYSQDGGNKRYVILFGLPSNEIIDPNSDGGIVVSATREAASGIYAYATPITVPANKKIVVVSLTDGASPIILNSHHNGVIGTSNRTFTEETVVYIGLTNKTGPLKYYIDGVTDGAAYVFKFGKGVGLKNNSRTPKNNKIITRLAGYGSETNIPFGYPQIIWEGDQSWDYTIDNDSTNPLSYPIYQGIVGGRYVKLIKHPFTRNHLMPSIYRETINKKVNPYADGYDPNTEIVDYHDAIGEQYPNPINPNAPSYEIHQFEDVKPELGEKNLVAVMPMESYLTKSDFDNEIGKKISTVPDSLDRKWLGDFEYYVDAETDANISVPQGTYKYHEEYYVQINVRTDNTYVYATYKSPTFTLDYQVVRDGAVPTVVWDDSMDDEGNYKQSYFKVTLPQLDFDLYACAAITQEMQINMRGGACIGCTFTIMCDWDDYKLNFYDQDGNFAPDGLQRDLAKYPKSNYGEITVILQKDMETFGVLMPNTYQQPKSGDQFVILGISLPQTYELNAETRLDGDMDEFLLENNIYNFEYPLKFSEAFLHDNVSILAQIRNNTIVRFEYNSATYALYVKEISIKYGEDVLPQYDITLTDDVEIVLNQIGAVAEDVSRMRVSVGELQKYYGDNIEKKVNEKLSRTTADVALGEITFSQGLISDEIRSAGVVDDGIIGSGFHLWRDYGGMTHLVVDKFTVRQTMSVLELLIDKVRSVGGMIVVSASNGKIKRVGADGDNYIITFENENTFVAHDLIRCSTWTGENLKSYWVEVASVVGDSVLVPISEFGDFAPQEGDECVLMGNTANANRQNVIVISASEDGQPRIDVYDKVSTTNFDNCLRTRLGSLDGIKDSVFGDEQPQGYGLYSDNAYLKGKFVLHNGDDIGVKFNILEDRVSSTVQGGIQMLQNGDFSEGIGFWRIADDTAGVAFAGDAGDIDMIWFNGDNAVLSSKPSFKIEDVYGRLALHTTQRTSYLEDYMINKPEDYAKVTLSFWVRTDGGQTLTFSCCGIDETIELSSQEWTKVTREYEWRSGSELEFVPDNDMYLSGVNFYVPSSSLIEQTADHIALQLNKTGINIEDKKITLNAETTNVSDNLIVKQLITKKQQGEAHIEASESEMRIFGKNQGTQPNIVFGVDTETGFAVLQFFDDAGHLMFDLGPNGFTDYIKGGGGFLELKQYALTSGDPTISKPEISSTATILYRYQPKIINNDIAQDAYNVVNGVSNFYTTAEDCNNKYFSDNGETTALKWGNTDRTYPNKVSGSYGSENPFIDWVEYYAVEEDVYPNVSPSESPTTYQDFVNAVNSELDRLGAPQSVKENVEYVALTPVVTGDGHCRLLHPIHIYDIVVYTNGNVISKTRYWWQYKDSQSADTYLGYKEIND